MQQVGDIVPAWDGHYRDPFRWVPNNMGPDPWPMGGPPGMDAKLNELIEAMNRLSAALEKHK